MYQFLVMIVYYILQKILYYMIFWIHQHL